MSSATIYFGDVPGGMVSARLDFGVGGVDEKSLAHMMALDALKSLQEKMVTERYKEFSEGEGMQ